MTIMRAQPHLKEWLFLQWLSPIIPLYNRRQSYEDNMAENHVPEQFETRVKIRNDIYNQLKWCHSSNIHTLMTYLRLRCGSLSHQYSYTVDPADTLPQEPSYFINS